VIVNEADETGVRPISGVKKTRVEGKGKEGLKNEGEIGR